MTTTPFEFTAPISDDDENSPEAISARRKELQAMEQAAIEILGPCPPDLHESTIDIPLADQGFVSHAIVIRPVSKGNNGEGHGHHQKKVKKCPLIVYMHGGSFAFGTPRFALSPARAFASYFGAVVVCPSYKLAPENPFPAPMQSAWEVVAWLSEPRNLNQGVLDRDEEGIEFDPALGFVLAGCSAGASISAVIAGIAAAARAGEGHGHAELVRGLTPRLVSPITGLFISLPHIVHRDIVPSKYASTFRSREENANAPIINAASLANSVKRLKTDFHSPWFSPLNLDLSEIKEHHPQRVYVHGGELDVLRDDAVIYERVLRDGGVAETKIDVLHGYGHVGWVSLPFPEAHTPEIKEKAMDGMAWVLGKDWDRSRPLPY
ncbi:uncharacterized protein Z520_01340 [Fonsecaea multimorphosa CBS 102226]|uniref:Alpha/beta hydrolase fold-3 domain-containing protein n=1 Tax=Fonsecaea multimorphosa CBS 102226 TaxID=1442371 RepID=A0A0D2KHE6_9EURO|nr:uncharacterized protein Z520_01340 [Fonsecaea multimorphosa CBS 102226]KIY02875.1 hypothetical protein Z520_01340 [Fonsecaea multimorphosa CBS 102226]OAL30712.1 hypothetical protein AYO22_01332 [Fonsecaea multimorphosa]